MTFLTELKANHKPFAAGFFSEVYLIDGKVVKVQEDGCYSDTLKEVVLQKAAADAGLAPDVYNIFEVPGAVVTVMEAVDTNRFKEAVEGTAIGVDMIVLGELSHHDMLLGAELFAKLIKAGILHADFHVQNWLIDRNTEETIALDFGVGDFLVDASKRHLQKGLLFLIPVLGKVGELSLALKAHEIYENGSEDEVREMLIKAADAILELV